MNALLIFSKYPSSGNVKTRLGQDLGMEFAANLHAAFLQDLIKEHQEKDYLLLLACPSKDKEAFETLYTQLEFYEVRGSNLGDHMLFAFQDLLPNFEKIAIIGSDIPTLKTERIHQAFSLLNNKDLVLGPDTGGGYYLVAMKEPLDIFSGITFSQGIDFEQTTKKIKQQNTHYALLPSETDIDIKEDLTKIKNKLDPDSATARILS